MKSSGCARRAPASHKCGSHRRSARRHQDAAGCLEQNLRGGICESNRQRFVTCDTRKSAKS
eukprot:7505694-Alexandrium_andersonii.AAC.1